jgi:hypothetical protein
MLFFIQGFYYHHIAGNLKKARKLYATAIKRTECPLGAYHMLISSYLYQSNDTEFFK